jgi:hypothetical protein
VQLADGIYTNLIDDQIFEVHNGLTPHPESAYITPCSFEQTPSAMKTHFFEFNLAQGKSTFIVWNSHFPGMDFQLWDNT